MSGENARTDERAAGAQRDVQDAVDAIQRTLADIDTAVDAARRGWQGDANTAFSKAVAAWNQETNDLRIALGQIEEKVGAGHVQLTQLDAEEGENFGGLRLA
ncbi:WXG100 family type VII secretion target [Nocardia bovistercoris]|uniref:WXG100 family type VII secretion target n=1 Tax=Nocardia bovistercoris TaxID=2785916 RepID=A0A931I9S6_9NOCA|nr:WXG100 family type VII secretion target [Nocardia bovistercoris]MBH0777582.1 WXG100 family type VII secretion target [Nocardia bovistercoris]